jgi:hypothetical protein
MLTAESPATPPQSLLTTAKSTQRLRFSATAGGVPGSVAAAAVGTGAAGLAGLGVFVVLRMRRRAGRPS